LQSYLPTSLLSRTALLTVPAFVPVHLLNINLLATCHVGVCSFAISNAPSLCSTAGPCRLAPFVPARQKQVNVFDFPYGILIINLQSRGFETPGTLTNSVEIGQARDKILSLKFNQVFSFLGLTLLYLTIFQISSTTSSFSTNGTSTSVDPKDYLTSVDSIILKSDVEIGNIKRARMLFDSLVKSNPKHASGWIAATCLEEHAGRIVAARKIIKQGCEQCPKSEDVWLEAARVDVSSALFFLSHIVNYYPHRITTIRKSSSPTPFNMSDKLSKSGSQLPSSSKAPRPKKCVLRKTPEHIPNSVCLRKEIANLESSASDARNLLARAVEVIPLSVQLWPTLAPLESMNISTAISKFPKLYMAQGQIHQQQSNTAARASFAAGIKSCPKEPTLWILAS
jgi:pre-mRNA-processing factor 6